jgi:hypothetical protein
MLLDAKALALSLAVHQGCNEEYESASVQPGPELRTVRLTLLALLLPEECEMLG